MTRPSRANAVSLAVAAGAGGLLILLAVIGLIVAYTGSYNIAATEEHTALPAMTPERYAAFGRSNGEGDHTH